MPPTDTTNMAQVPPSKHNPRGRYDRTDDNIGMWGALIAFANRHGPIALIAAFLVYFLSNILLTEVRKNGQISEDTKRIISNHVSDTNWYLRQACINTSVLAGQPPAQCEPPRKIE